MVWRYTLIFGSEVPAFECAHEIYPVYVKLEAGNQEKLPLSYMLIGFYIFYCVCFGGNITNFQKTLSNKPKDFCTGRYYLMLTLF